MGVYHIHYTRDRDSTFPDGGLNYGINVEKSLQKSYLMWKSITKEPGINAVQSIPGKYDTRILNEHGDPKEIERLKRHIG